MVGLNESAMLNREIKADVDSLNQWLKILVKNSSFGIASSKGRENPNADRKQMQELSIPKRHGSQ